MPGLATEWVVPGLQTAALTVAAAVALAAAGRWWRGRGRPALYAVAAFGLLIHGLLVPQLPRGVARWYAARAFTGLLVFPSLLVRLSRTCCGTGDAGLRASTAALVVLLGAVALAPG